MDEYAHNHPPRCCCALPDDPVGVHTRCELCPEHGELAQLGNSNPANAIPAGVVIADLAYSCCHQLVGRPHTEYCPTLRAEAEADEMARAGLDLGMTRQPTTGTRGTATDRLHIGAALTPGAIIPTHERHQCHPDHCGMWATTTTQPPTQTSTPSTQARSTPLAGPTPGTCPSCGLNPDNTPALNCQRADWHDHPR